MAKEKFLATCEQEERVCKLLNSIQHWRFGPYQQFLMGEDWDWYVVLECLQDNGLFVQNAQRMPLNAFVNWLTAHHVPQYLCKASAFKMSMACRALRGVRYPWSDIYWYPAVLRRWRILYDELNKALKQWTQIFV